MRFRYQLLMMLLALCTLAACSRRPPVQIPPHRLDGVTKDQVISFGMPASLAAIIARRAAGQPAFRGPDRLLIGTREAIERGDYQVVARHPGQPAVSYLAQFKDGRWQRVDLSDGTVINSLGRRRRFLYHKVTHFCGGRMVVALFANNQLVGTKLILSDFGGLALTHDGTGKLDQKALIRINRPPPGIRSSWGPGGRGFTLKNSKTGAIIRFSKTGRRVFPDGVKPSSGASETFASDTTRIRHLTIAGARLALVHDIARRQVRVVVNKAGQNSRIINASDVCARRFIHTTEVMPRGTKTWRVHRAAGAEKLLVARDLAPARLFSQLRAQKGRAQGLEGRQAFLIEGLFVVDLARSSGGVVEHRLKGVLVQPSGMKPISARLGPDGTLQIVGPAVSR